jgi:hypothetical protein
VKKTKIDYRLKYTGILLCTILFTGLYSSSVLAEGLDIYGNFTAVFSYDKLNPDSLVAKPNLGTFLGGNLYLQKKDENQFQYLLDLKFNGSLVDSQAETAPVAMTVNQLYILVPFSDKTFLYCGKKMKEIGVSNFFNVSNLISPKFLVNNSFTRNGVGLVELDRIQSDGFSYGFITDFQNAANWEEIQGVAFTDIRWGNFYLEDYLYLQKSTGCSLGLDATYQMGKYQLYMESLLKGKAQQRVVSGSSGDPASDFTIREWQNTPAIVLGGSITVDNFVAALEYLYNQNGYNAKEQADFIDYFRNYPSAPQIGNYYSRCAFTQNYLGLKLNWANFMEKEMTLGLVTLVSLQPGSSFQEGTSYEVSTNLEYTFNQNLDFNFYLTYRNGGDKGEFNRLYTDLNLTLLMNYSF